MKYIIVLLGVFMLCGCSESFEGYTAEPCHKNRICKKVGVNAEMCEPVSVSSACRLIKYHGEIVGECYNASDCHVEMHYHKKKLNEPSLDEKLEDMGVKIIK